MSKTTKNLHLTKPEPSDNITPTVFADNFDTIDEAITKANNGISTANKNISKCNSSISSLQKNMNEHDHSGKILWPANIEFTGGTKNGGYIDFHFEGSKEDYTSRIAELKSGMLEIESTIPKNAGPIKVSKTGTYGGNGSSSSRDIQVNGMGHFIAVWSERGCAIVTPSGAFTGTGSAVSFVSGATCTNGVIHLSTSNSVLNANGVTYSYQVL